MHHSDNAMGYELLCQLLTVVAYWDELFAWRGAQAAVHLPGFYEVDDVLRGNSWDDGGA